MIVGPTIFGRISSAAVADPVGRIGKKSFNGPAAALCRRTMDLRRAGDRHYFILRFRSSSGVTALALMAHSGANQPEQLRLKTAASIWGRVIAYAPRLTWTMRLVRRRTHKGRRARTHSGESAPRTSAPWSSGAPLASGYGTAAQRLEPQTGTLDPYFMTSIASITKECQSIIFTNLFGLPAPEQVLAMQWSQTHPFPKLLTTPDNPCRIG